MSLEIVNLSKTYPNGVQALRDVTLTIPRGLYGLLGPNGAGKSSLMRTLASLQTPDSGSIRFHGTPVLDDPQAHRARLGYLPQDFGVYPGVAALDLLEYVAVLKGLHERRARRAQIEALLVQTNLWEHRKRAVSGFSGGMRQRFGIAQALLGHPQLIIVDEPTAGLDPEERNRFHNLLSEIGENVVVILSTHIVEDVRQLCPRMAILAGGRVLRAGGPDELVAELRGRVWGKAVPKAAGPRLRADGLLVLSARLHAGQTRLRVLADAPPAPGFAPVEPELEDVYFHELARAQALAAGPVSPRSTAR
jgi:ABC-type multidrug transport system ATPase subunit